MKHILTTLALLAILCGCGDGNPRSSQQQQKITPEDVAWATGTKIYKWRLSTLTSEPVYSVGIVLLGPTNEVLFSPSWIGESAPFTKSQDQLRIAIQKTDAGLDLKLGACGATVNSHLGADFKMNTSYGPTFPLTNNLLLIATDDSTAHMTPKAALDSRSKKLCLKIYTEPRSPANSVSPSGAAQLQKK